MEDFISIRKLDNVVKNILPKRYLRGNETEWRDVVERVIDFIIPEDDKQKSDYYDMLYHRYFVPNSPTLANANTRNGGLSACFVVDMTDSIMGIYKTKLDFALIAKKGGGCGTTLTNLRPENSIVAGSAHGYAGGPVRFFDTICHDMKAMTQSGFREMAMMGTMSVYHPDIIKFITAKTKEGVMHTTNISVTVDNEFMKKVVNNETYWTRFGGNNYNEYKARDIFNLIVENAWQNGEPGLLFYDRMNDSPYKYSGQKIQATNPCGEQPLPPNGVCNLGSLDISKFITTNLFDLQLFEKAVRLSIRFLDASIDVNTFPTDEITQWARDNRPIGLGIMGLADYFLEMGIAYGSKESIKETERIMKFMKEIAYNESQKLGLEKGIPLSCQVLPIPRRNITVLTIAPTGTISLVAGCNSSIEPIFSEYTVRNDTTGNYKISHKYSKESHFKCAVAANGAKEVTWKEHIDIQNIAQKYVDSGVSKTINLPNSATREDIYNALLYAWKCKYIKGITIYRNGSRNVEVLSPKIENKNRCPICDNELIAEAGCKHCSNCDYSVCEIQ